MNNIKYTIKDKSRLDPDGGKWEKIVTTFHKDENGEYPLYNNELKELMLKLRKEREEK